MSEQLQLVGNLCCRYGKGGDGLVENGGCLGCNCPGGCNKDCGKDKGGKLPKLECKDCVNCKGCEECIEAVECEQCPELKQNCVECCVVKPEGCDNCEHEVCEYCREYFET